MNFVLNAKLVGKPQYTLVMPRVLCLQIEVLMVDMDLFSTIPEKPNRGPKSLVVLDDMDVFVPTDVVECGGWWYGSGGWTWKGSLGTHCVVVVGGVVRALNSMRGFNRRLTMSGETISRAGPFVLVLVLLLWLLLNNFRSKLCAYAMDRS